MFFVSLPEGTNCHQVLISKKIGELQMALEEIGDPLTTAPSMVPIHGGTPIAGWFFFQGKSHLQMDDDLGVPLFFRKPPQSQAF